MRLEYGKGSNSYSNLRTYIEKTLIPTKGECEKEIESEREKGERNDIDEDREYR